MKLVVILASLALVEAREDPEGHELYSNTSRGDDWRRSPLFGGLQEILSTPDWTEKVINLIESLSDIFSGPPYPLRTVNLPASKYDYVVIGAGAAGSAIAASLSENPSVNVAVLEAGWPETRFTATPITTSLQWRSVKDWKFQTVPQKFSSFAFKDGILPIIQGRSIGGCSAINALAYIRGHYYDYERWVQLGAEGWSYRDVFPYFFKFEGVADQGSAIYKPGYHNYRGPIKVSGEVRDEVSGAMMDAIKELGWPIGDLNAGDNTRFDYMQSTKAGGVRCSSACAFLGPASFRPNLDVVPGAFVRKILFDGTRAKAVEFEKNGTIYAVYAKKEVILAAGALQSPKILILSGVGPRQELGKLGIPVVNDLPGVGKNLQDHATLYAYFTIRKGMSLVYTRTDQVVEVALQYLKNGTGPFSISETIGGFLRTKYAVDLRPDIELAFFKALPGSLFSNIQQGFATNTRDDITKNFFVPHSSEDGIQISISSVRPFIRGSVALKSADPHDKPIVDIQYLAQEMDFKKLLEGYKLALGVEKTRAMREGLDARLFQQHLPGCEKFQLYSEEYNECYVRNWVNTDLHYCCSNKMGSRKDPMAVVGPDLRVRGVQNLRVIDSSVMPEIPTGNTYVPTVTVALRGADIIKGQVLPPYLPSKKNLDKLTYSLGNFTSF